MVTEARYWGPEHRSSSGVFGGSYSAMPFNPSLNSPKKDYDKEDNDKEDNDRESEEETSEGLEDVVEDMELDEDSNE